MKISIYQKYGKRLFDLGLSFSGLVIAAPLLFLIAILIKLDSPGAIIFRQKRVGQGGKLFTIYKFRVMQKNAARWQAKYASLNEADGPVFKIRNDPRLTKLGRWLRHYGLDELPQLFNVLLGTMSLVGPRPLPPAEEAQIPSPWRRRRKQLKPGIFSFWTAQGAKHNNFRHWMKSDLAYQRAISLKTDCRIIIQTAKMLLRR